MAAKSRKRILVLFVASQLVTFGVMLEIGARIFDPLGISYYPETARLFDAMILEEPIGYRLRPGMEGWFHGAHVEVNDVGMRDRPVARPKPDGEFRVLTIGDSVMFSVGVEIEDSIPWQIEKLANEEAPPGVRYRTLNMGVPSYNTEQERIQLEQIGLSLKPDVAVQLFILNDLESKMWVYEKRASRLTDFAQRSYGASFLYKVVRPWAKRIVDTLIPRNSKRRSKPRSELLLARSPRHHRALEELGRIHELLREAGVPFLLLVHKNVGEPFQRRIEEFGRSEGFDVRAIDVWGDPRWSGLDRIDYMNSRSDSHCNPQGCAILARLMLDRMHEVGLLDPSR